MPPRAASGPTETFQIQQNRNVAAMRWRGGLAVNWLARSFQKQLVEAKIKPTPKLKGCVLDSTRMYEPQLFVQRNTGGIGDVYATDHDVILLLGCGGNEPLHERKTKALAAMIFVYVNRMLN